MILNLRYFTVFIIITTTKQHVSSSAVHRPQSMTYICCGLERLWSNLLFFLSLHSINLFVNFSLLIKAICPAQPSSKEHLYQSHQLLHISSLGILPLKVMLNITLSMTLSVTLYLLVVYLLRGRVPALCVRTGSTQWSNNFRFRYTGISNFWGCDLRS